MSRKKTEAKQGEASSEITGASPWSARSQASLLREQELIKQREHLQFSIGTAKRELGELEERRRSILGWIGRGESESVASATRNAEAIRKAKDKLAALQEAHKLVEEKIQSERLTSEQAAERSRNQEALAELVEQRLVLHAEIETAVGQLRDKLSADSALAGRMAELAQAVELEADLDAGRWDGLLAALPENITQESRLWLDGFLGRGESLIRCFAHTRLVVGETLSSSGVFAPGDELFLTQQEFLELHRTDRPLPLPANMLASDEVARRPLHLPQGVLTPEEFEAACAAAKKEGLELADYFSREDRQRDEESKRRRQGQRERAQGLASRRGLTFSQALELIQQEEEKTHA